MSESASVDIPVRLSCEVSAQVGEPLAGTALRTDVWLLLEYAAPWGAKAYEESALPEPIRAHLDRALAALPNSRMQFVKRESSKTGDGGAAFYLALSREHPALYRFDLGTLDDLLSLDIPAIAAGAPAYDAHRSAETLYLVCTNAKRDACCALLGLPLYRQLRALAGDAVWQITHIGGHRFAGTLVCLPAGVYYGRVSEADAAALVAAHRQGGLYLERCRGRCCYEQPAQVAELHIRAQTGITTLDGLRLSRFEPEAGGYVVQFAVNGALHTVRLAEERSTFQVYESSTSPEPMHVKQYRVLDYRLSAG